MHVDLRQAPQAQAARSLWAVWPAILGLALVFLVEMLDTSVLTVALPTIARDLQATAADLQWVVSGYSLLFGGLMIAFGAVADRYGTRRVLLVGLGLFAAANLAVVAVRTPAELVAVRAAVGVTAAMTAPGTMALCFRLFDDEGLLMRATAAISTVGLVGLAVGPPLGGLVLQVLPWQALLLAGVPVAALAAACIRYGVPADDPAQLHRAPIDLLGALLGTATLVLVLRTATLAVDAGDHAVWQAGVGALACGAGFVAWERRTAHPVVDLALIRRPQVSAALAYQAALGLGLAALAYTVSLQLQLAWGWTPAEAALGSLPQVVTMIAAGPLVERLVRRVGTRTAGPAGASAVIAGLLVYALLGRHHYAWIALALVLTAAGMRVVMVIAAVAVVRGMPPDRASSGAALTDTSQEVATSIGLAVAGTVVAAALAGPLTDVGTSTAVTDSFERGVTTATLALTTACAALVVWAARRERRPDRATTT